MSVRAARRLLFALLVLTAPLPLLGPFDALAPPARYGLLFAASLAVAVAEGAAGPVPGMVALFGIHFAVYLGLGWLAAWCAARGLARLSPRARAGVVLAAIAAVLVAALALEPYRTPFGRAPTAGLWSVLS